MIMDLFWKYLPEVVLQCRNVILSNLTNHIGVVSHCGHKRAVNTRNSTGNHVSGQLHLHTCRLAYFYIYLFCLCLFPLNKIVWLKHIRRVRRWKEGHVSLYRISTSEKCINNLFSRYLLLIMTLLVTFYTFTWFKIINTVNWFQCCSSYCDHWRAVKRQIISEKTTHNDIQSFPVKVFKIRSISAVDGTCKRPVPLTLHFENQHLIIKWFLTKSLWGQVEVGHHIDDRLGTV